MIVTDTEGSMVTAQSTTYPSNTVTRNSSPYHKLKFPPSTSILDMQSLPEVIPDSKAVCDTGMTQTDDDVEQTEQVQSPTPKKISPSTPDPIRRSSRLPQPPAYLQHYAEFEIIQIIKVITETSCSDQYFSCYFFLKSDHSFDSVLCTYTCIVIIEVNVFCFFLHLH